MRYLHILYKISLLVILALTFSACTTMQQTTPELSMAPSHGFSWHSYNPLHLLHKDGIWHEIRSDFKLDDFSDRPEVKTQIRWYQKHSKSLENYLGNAGPYLYYIYHEAKRRGLPAELVLIPILESGYNPYDYSNVGATGLWQIMPATARSLGLKISWWYDERRDLNLSTQAALKYLTYLSKYFDNNWLLSVAAYDAGEGTVQSALNRNLRDGEGCDFWSLQLSQETTMYVPRFLALAAIIRDPERYGINLPDIADKPYLQAVNAGGQLDLNQAAALAGIDFDKLRKFNAGYRRITTPPNGPYTLLLPIANAERLQKKLATLAPTERITWRQHNVVAGETITQLAKHYHVSVTLLRQVNDLKGKGVKTNQIILVPANYAQANIDSDSSDTIENMHAEAKIPEPGKVTSRRTEEATAAVTQVNNTYTVKAKDSLASIAHHCGTTVPSLRQLNRLSSDHLYIGQKLQLPSIEKSRTVTQKANRTQKNMPKRKTHHKKNND
jgi:membrane-bound lytic murein transglycosylase D